mgnify:CR=1 FL=1
MVTRTELLKQKEEIEKQLQELANKEYQRKIVIFSNPDLTEGRFPFYSKKEFYIIENQGRFDSSTLVNLIESIYSKKYGLYDGVMGSIYNLMETFKVSLRERDTADKNDLPILKLSELSTSIDKAIKQINDFLETVPIKSNTKF